MHEEHDTVVLAEDEVHPTEEEGIHRRSPPDEAAEAGEPVAVGDAPADVAEEIGIEAAVDDAAARRDHEGHHQRGGRSDDDDDEPRWDATH